MTRPFQGRIATDVRNSDADISGDHYVDLELEAMKAFKND
jgi:hypothetical protein